MSEPIKDELPPKENDQTSKLPEDVPLPAPTLLSLVNTLTTQALVSMGIFPHPVTGKSEFFLHQAQHLIDTIDLIFQKTEGHRTEEETKMIGQSLHELKMLFVAAQEEKNKREQKA